MRKFIYPWSESELKRIRLLRNPAGVQAFLDGADYNKGSRTLTPGEVLRRRKAHCFDGAVFAASVFEVLGLPPLIMDLRAVRDDDHVLAVFKVKGCYGAVAKSNYTGLRFREPIYRSVRELAVSYFEGYFNLQREKTLREYSGVFNLERAGKPDWDNSQDHFYNLAVRLDSLPHFPVLPAGAVRKLEKADLRTFRAGKLGRR